MDTIQRKSVDENFRKQQASQILTHKIIVDILKIFRLNPYKKKLFFTNQR